MWVGWFEWSEHGPKHTKFYLTLSYPNLHFPTKFHQNQTKIAKVCYRGDFWGGVADINQENKGARGNGM